MTNKIGDATNDVDDHRIISHITQSKHDLTITPRIPAVISAEIPSSRCQAHVAGSQSQRSPQSRCLAVGSGNVHACWLDPFRIPGWFKLNRFNSLCWLLSTCLPVFNVFRWSPILWVVVTFEPLALETKKAHSALRSIAPRWSKDLQGISYGFHHCGTNSVVEWECGTCRTHCDRLITAHLYGEP